MYWRDERFGELLAMKSANPSRLIMIFRNATDLGELDPLPTAYGLNEMIAVILEREERQHESHEIHDNLS
jgi:hypothetical protein